MKKLILLFLVLSGMICFAQTPTSVIRIPSATTTFKNVYPSGTFFWDTTAKYLYSLSTSATASKTLNTVSKKNVMLSYTSGTGITISGNTITNSLPRIDYVAGTGITINSYTLSTSWSTAGAPSITTGGFPANYYGSIGSSYLSAPVGWLYIVIGGITYKIPYYQ